MIDRYRNDQWPGPTRNFTLLGVLLAVALMAALLLTAPPAVASFADVPTDHPYGLQVDVMSQLGVVGGFSDGTFRPDEPVTRQQFAKMVVLAMRIPVSEADVSPFSDVQIMGLGTLYPDNYVAAVARDGITLGTGGTQGGKPRFDPGAPVSLAQVVTMMTRASGRTLATPPSSYRSVWGDFNHAHGPTARIAQYNGLLRYLPSVLGASPWRHATRAETAALLYNLMGTDPLGMNGLFLGSSADLVSYFRKQGRTSEQFTVPLAELAKTYVLLGRRFGIRADMAWAQMVHETGFGEYQGDVRPEQNNMAGIGATGGGVPGNFFATAELGVIAQYAHLAWYIYPDHLEDLYCRKVADYDPASTDPNVPGDPRHFVVGGLVHRGNVRVVHDLSGKWAPGAEYGAGVLRHQKGIPVTVGW
ncbi:MAG: S-layer homology domain-containing protein [Thermoleophilia bacterium]